MIKTRHLKSVLIFTLIVSTIGRSTTAWGQEEPGSSFDEIKRLLLPTGNATDSVMSTTPEEFAKIFTSDHSVVQTLVPRSAWPRTALENNCLKAMTATIILCDPASQMSGGMPAQANEMPIWKDRSRPVIGFGETVIDASFRMSRSARQGIALTTASAIQAQINPTDQGVNPQCDVAAQAAEAQSRNYNVLWARCNQAISSTDSYCGNVKELLEKKLNDNDFLAKTKNSGFAQWLAQTSSIFLTSIKQQIQAKIQSLTAKGQYYSQQSLKGRDAIGKSVEEFRALHEKAKACDARSAQPHTPPPPAPAPAPAPPRQPAAVAAPPLRQPAVVIADPAPAPAGATPAAPDQVQVFASVSQPAPAPSADGTGIDRDTAMIVGGVGVAGVGIAAVAGAFRKGGGGGSPATTTPVAATPACQNAGTQYCQMSQENISRLGMAIESISQQNPTQFSTAIDNVLFQNGQISSQFQTVSYSGSVPGLAASAPDYAAKERAYSYANRLGQLIESNKIRTEDLMSALKNSDATIFNQINSAYRP